MNGWLKRKKQVREGMFKKIFTPQEANRRLPLVKKIVTDILLKGKRLRKILEKNRSDEIPVECHNLQSEIEELMTELEDLGCYYKDWNFEYGLVDFPARIEGREVLLCWRSDEPDLRWYHGFEDGYMGRKEIPSHLLSDPRTPFHSN